jgi:hypothetical protein
MFAAIGLAYQFNMTAIWAINHNKNDEKTYNVVDLRTRTGRDHEKIGDGSKIAIRSAALPLI